MTSESDPQQNPLPSNVPPPPPAPIKRQRPKRKKKILIAGISVGVALALAGGGAAIAVSSNTTKLEEYDEAHNTVTSIHTESTEMIEEAGLLEPDLQERLESQLSITGSLLDSEAPRIMSFNVDGRIDELNHSRDDLRASRISLREAINNRDSYASAASGAEDTLKEAEDLLKKTKDKILDKDAYKQLSGQVGTLKDALADEPDETSGEAFADSTSEIEDAASAISDSSPSVSASHDEWKDAEEEAAQRDPKNYKIIGQRDWQLVQRDPDAHEGEKYVIYGKVTQADANMGAISIRVNTGATQQSRGYDYDINTVVLSGSSDIFSDVVQDDHVKMLIEVSGSMTYDTTIGGSATAVEVIAYDVDVIGQF